MRQMSERSAVVLDSQPLWIEAIGGVLQRVGLTVAAATTSEEEALGVIERETPDLLVVGVDPAGSAEPGLDLIRRLRAAYPDMAIIALAAKDGSASVSAVLEAGASAYVLKTVHPDDLAAAVRQSFGPSVYFADAPVYAPASAAPSDASASDDAGLTRREVEILRLVAEGDSNAALARRLWVTEQTVKFHLSNIYRKLDVANRTEASRWAQLHGLLDGDPDADAAPLGRRLLVGTAI